MELIFDEQRVGDSLIFDSQTAAVGDTTPPNVSLIASPAKITTAGAITLQATATDDSGIQRVEFYRGAVLLGSDALFPYSFSTNLNESNNGVVSFFAKAFDTVGNSAIAESVVEVDIAATGVRSISVAFTTDGVNPAPNMSGMKYAWWDAALPNSFGAPLLKGNDGVVANGVFSMPLPNSVLNPGAHGCLALTSGNGLSTESPEAITFFGPVPVN